SLRKISAFPVFRHLRGSVRLERGCSEAPTDPSAQPHGVRSFSIHIGSRPGQLPGCGRDHPWSVPFDGTASPTSSRGTALPPLQKRATASGLMRPFPLVATLSIASAACAPMTPGGGGMEYASSAADYRTFDQRFEEDVAPVLQTYGTGCHGG